MSLKNKNILLTIITFLSFGYAFSGSDPTAAFSITPGAVVSPGTTVCFDDNSSAGGIGLDIISWVWTFDSPGTNYSATTSGTANPPCVTYTLAGTYQICLEVENEDNNTDQICQTITVAPPFNIGDENGTTQTGCGFLIIDDGGNGNYGNNEDNFITICSGNGDNMQLDFSLLDLANGDIIEIYNGSGVSGSPISTITFTQNGASPTIFGTEACITIRFVTNGSGTGQGFLVQANCYNGDDVIISANDGATITGCGGNFYDSGGSGAGYTNGENYTVTLCADNANDVIQILFQQFHLASGDVLNVYDGVGTGGSLIYTANNSDNGNNSFIFPGLTITGISQCVTYEFISNGSGTDSGWLGNIDCETPPPNCNPGNNPPASDNFEAATMICDFSHYCGETSSFYGVDMGFLGQSSQFDGSLENNSWLSFVADATTVQFLISVTDGSCGSIQIGIYGVDAAGNFTWLSTPDINGGFDYTNIDDGFSGTNEPLNAAGLVPGQTYYIMIDGHGGDDCPYTLTANIGVQLPSPVASGPGSLCIGDAGTVSVLDQNGSTNVNWIWTWTPGAGGPVAGSSVDLSTFPAGTYTFNVVADGFENCADPSDVSDQVTVTINPCGCVPPVIDIDPVSACTPNTADLNNAINASSDPATISFHASAADANSDINPISATVGTSNTYFVRAEDPGDPTCFVVETITVTINPLPTVNAGSGASMCAGDPAITISASGDAGSYSWDNGLGAGASHSVSPATTTTYTVTLIDGNGCQNTDDVTITVNSCACTPPTFTVTPPSQLCAPATYNLTTGVSATGGNTVTYHATNADATADINPLASTTVSVSGTYYIRVEDPSDPTCFAVQSIAVTVNAQTTPTFDGVSPICSGDALAALPTTSTNAITGTWSPALNNTATTTYTFTPTAGQCATTNTLSITVNPPTTPTFDGVSPICSGDALAALPTTSTNAITGTWSPALNNTATTTYTFTPTAGQCATTTTLSITVNPIFNSIDDVTVCTGSNYTYPDGVTSTNITVDESHTSTLVSALGCDSVIVTNITINSAFTSTANINVCSGNNFTYADGTTSTNITVNENHVSAYVTATGCDSLVTQNLIVLPVYNPTVAVNACENSTYIYPDGFTEVITGNTSHVSNLTTGAGCDSIITTNVTMNPIFNLNVNVNACENSTYTYPDGFASVITADESHTSNLSSAAGCDSIIVTNVTMGPPQTTTFNSDICSGTNFTYADGTASINITANESHVSTLTTASGCDSIVTENLTIVLSISNTVNTDICSGTDFTYADGTSSTNILADENHISNLVSANGCDSILTQNLTILPNLTNTVNTDICSGSNFTYADGTTSTNITVNENHISNLISASGCDSVLTQNLNLVPAISNTINIDQCSGLNFTYADGTTSTNILANENHISNLISASGCDSNVTQNINVLPLYNSIEDVNSCENATYTYPDGFTSVITANESHTSNLVSAGGCDSIIVTNVTMNPIFNLIENVDACENSTYTYPDGNTSIIAANESHTSNLTSAAGCDSIIVTNVTMVTNYNAVDDITACENSTVTYPDGSTATITASTSYTSTLVSATGCDSIVVTNVTMNPIFNTIDNITVCENATVTYPDGTTATITASTTYTSNLISASGCDSIIVTNVTMNALPVFLLASTNPTTCGATDGTVTISGLTPATTYSVSFNGNANANMTTNAAGEIVFTGLATGSYTSFYVENTNGCSTLDNSVLNISPLGAPTIDNTSKINLSCSGDNSGEIHLDASGGTGVITYEIDNGAGLVQTNLTGDFTTLPAGTYAITITDGTGCETTDIVVLNEPGNIIQTVNSTDILCFGDANGTITWLTVTGGTPPYAYSINNGGNYSPGSVFNGLTGGNYNVTVHDLNGCNSDTSTVVIFEPNELLLSAVDIPITQPSCVNGAPNCNGTITVNVPIGGGTAPYTYIWPNNIAQPTINNAVDLCGGQYNIAIEDMNGCLSAIQVNLVNPASPTIDDISLVGAGCGNDCNGEINIDAPTGITFSINGFSQNNGYFTGLCQGNYTVVVSNAGNCSATQSVSIENVESPDAQFIFDPGYGTIENSEITFTNLSEFADSYFWSISGYAPNEGYFWATTDEEFSHIFPATPGTYQVCLAAYADAGCGDTACTDIVIRDDFNIFVPNAFTPDGDAHNQTFKPVLTGIDVYNYQLLIFDRWGELIFESHNKEVGWDGTYMGKLVQDGVYVWKIDAKLGYTDEKRTFIGHVTLLK